MKRNSILFGFGVAVAMLPGCTDLDVDVKSVYTDYPDSEIAVEAKMSDALFAFRGALGRRFDEALSLNSDEYIGVSFSGDYLNGRDCAYFSTHHINPDACANQLNTFNDIMSGSLRCAELLVAMDAEENPMECAQLRAARAFYTFLLMDNWGDAPIITLDGNEVLRTARKDVALWIESELIECIGDLPTEVSAETYGRPTRWMADALLAKLYINWNVYTQDVTSASWSSTAANEKLDECIAVCDDVIKSGLFDLSDDYKRKFFYDNGPHVKDFIYVMPFDAVSQQGLTYARFRTWRRGQKDNGFYTIEMSNSCGGNMTLNPDFVRLFTLEGDRRNDCIAGDATQATTEIYQYDALTGEVAEPLVRNTYKDEDITFSREVSLVSEDEDLNCGANTVGWTQGYRSIKFFPNIEEYNTYSRNQSNDVPIFRYADVLLMKAEAIVRGGSATNGDSPLTLFNQIRGYVNAPLLTAAPTLQDILDERGREFLDEHWRRNDLIRFGDFERTWGFKYVYAGNGALTNRLFPLSTDVLNVNTNWGQNLGY